MANHYYDEDVSFYMPAYVVDPNTGYTVRLNTITITGISGLPVGLGWQTNASGSQYQPAGGDTLGCIKFCGTPITPGTYNITVFITAEVTALNTPIGDVDETSYQFYNSSITVLPDTAGGVGSFTFTPQVNASCDPLTLTFEATVDGDPDPTRWFWNFGNGNTASGKQGGMQTFSNPGTYPVVLTTKIYLHVIREVIVTDVWDNWSGDIEELTTLQNPDLYFVIPDLGLQSNTAPSGTSAVWTNRNDTLPPGTTSFQLEVWDEDNGPPLGSPDDYLGTATINVHAGTFSWSAGNGTYGQITIDTVVGTVIRDTLPVTIFEHPAPAVIQSPYDTTCIGDTFYLTIASTPHVIRWIHDTLEVPNATDTFLKVYQSGTYMVVLTDSNGCQSVSAPRPIIVANYPPTPTFTIQGNILTAQLSNFDIQWYYDSLPIPGANSVTLVADSPGIYQLEYTNRWGCSKISQPYFHTPVGINSYSYHDIITVFPNPARDVLHIRFNNPLPSGFTLS
ncbi:MAG: PKD domain-containing protein, partial [Chloroflexi bacterium]